MSQFIDYEAMDTDSSNLEEEEEDQEDHENDQESSFIDDNIYFTDQAPSNYRFVKGVKNFEESVYVYATNVSISYEEAIALNHSEHYEYEGDICNFVFDNDSFSETKEEPDETKITQSRIKKFEKSLNQKCEKSKDSFFNAILWGAYFKVKPDKNLNAFAYSDEELKNVSGVDFVNKFMEIKDDIVLDINLDTFEHKMHLVNDLLYEKNMFLHLYEKKNKFRYLFRKGHDENEVQKEVSSGVEQQYNGFHVTMHMCDKNRHIDFESVDIVYKPVKHLHEVIECYFTNEINQAFIVRLQHSKNIRLFSSTGFVRYYCNTYCTTKRFLKNICVFAQKKTGVVYSFNNRHLTTFEDNFKLIGDQPFSVYFDLEITCGKDKFVFDLDEDHLTDMYVVSYCFIVTFHKSYSLDKVRSSEKL